MAVASLPTGHTHPDAIFQRRRDRMERAADDHAGPVRVDGDRYSTLSKLDAEEQYPSGAHLNIQTINDLHRRVHLFR
jgi:hypothetical protein